MKVRLSPRGSFLVFTPETPEDETQLKAIHQATELEAQEVLQLGSMDLVIRLAPPTLPTPGNRHSGVTCSKCNKPIKMVVPAFCSGCGSSW